MSNVFEISQRRDQKKREQEVIEDRIFWGETYQDEMRLYRESVQKGKCRMCELEKVLKGKNPEPERVFHGFCCKKCFNDYHQLFGVKYPGSTQPREISFDRQDAEDSHRLEDLAGQYGETLKALRYRCRSEGISIDELEDCLAKEHPMPLKKVA